MDFAVVKSNLPQMITLKEAHDATGLSVYSLRQLCAQNKVIHFRINSKYYINADSLVGYLKESNEIKA